MRKPNRVATYIASGQGRRQLLVPCLAMMFVYAAPASAQDLPTEQLALENYEPGAPERNVLGVETSAVPGHLVPSADILFHRSEAPLVRRGEDVSAIADDRWTLDLGLGIGLVDRLALDIRLATVMSQTGSGLVGSNVPDFSTGDIRLRGKWLLVQTDGDGTFGVALQAAAYLPTGEDQGFVSDGVARFEPRVDVDVELGKLLLAANIGYQVRGNRNVGNSYRHDDIFRWGLAARLPIASGFGVDGSLYGSHGVFGLENPFEGRDLLAAHPVETVAAVTWRRKGFFASLGAGTGLTRGVGTPRLRALVSIGYTPERQDDELYRVIEAGDPDGDGLYQGEDRCPREAEDHDGDHDADGCPDLDEDRDEVADADDACPLEAGVPEKQGCPRIDTDADGVDDAADACPTVAGRPEFYGCEATSTSLTRTDTPDETDAEAGADGATVTPIDFESIPYAVYFNTAAAEFQPHEHPLIQTLSEEMQRNPDIAKVVIEGHTDSRGDSEMNKELGRERAQTVREIFVRRGIEPDRIEVRSYGEERPLDTNDTPEGRRRNRRVAFRFVRRRDVAADPQVRSTAPLEVTQIPTLTDFDTEPGSRLGENRILDGAEVTAPAGWACATEGAPPTRSVQLRAERAPEIRGVLYPGWESNVTLRCERDGQTVELPVTVEIPSFAVGGRPTVSDHLLLPANHTSTLAVTWGGARLPLDADAEGFAVAVFPHTHEMSRVRIKPSGAAGDSVLRIGTRNRPLLNIPIRLEERAPIESIAPRDTRWLEVAAGTSVLFGGASIVEPDRTDTALASVRFSAHLLASDWFSTGLTADIGPTLGLDPVVFSPGFGAEAMVHAPLGAVRPFVSAGAQIWLPRVVDARPALETAFGTDWEPVPGSGLRLNLRLISMSLDGNAVLLPGANLGAYTTF